jgi:FSR family fosmidomycin resistance protein-like MFS transporter
MSLASDTAPSVTVSPSQTAFRILLAISLGHLLNDMIQSLIPSIYPILKQSYGLTFAEIGLITLTWQGTASILQPIVGWITDRRGQPFSLPVGMGFTLSGLLVLSQASNFPIILLAVGLIGIGSSIFHPESSRVARMASGGRHGMAQSLFQVGGNMGSAAGPLVAAFVILPGGQSAVAWFALVALAGILLLTRVSFWYRARRQAMAARQGAGAIIRRFPDAKIGLSLAVLSLLVFSKFLYMASLSNYYTFYLIHTFGLTVRQAQLYLFVYLGSVALGTIIGGPIGDRFGRRTVIWFSVLGVLPFTLLLPYANLEWTVGLSIVIGLILSSAFPAVVVFAQELVPDKVGAVSGLFFGFAFGMGGFGAALLGLLADHTSVDFMYHVVSFLPAVGLLTIFLPKDRKSA